MRTVKQKTRASADFLGVLAIPRKVVGRCCFSITLFSLQSAQRGPGFYAGLRSRGVRATNQDDSKSGSRRQAVAAMQKGRSVTAAAFVTVKSWWGLDPARSGLTKPGLILT